ncbi:SDR family NAD(P)-dependent oxidoreductase [Streptosporangium sp. NPDC002544]|uniref:SDR family NAD(P)-dependent oxidoreductase n=1 Tax=Streptosporangium sp. NPDC002544 TaxID=3154538 RepID=UPI00331E56FD
MTDEISHHGEVALVTGANKGIGLEIARQLAALGMTVLVGARDPRRRDEAVAALRPAGGDVWPVALDVTDAPSVGAAAVHIDDQFGRLDVLINNAGISGGADQAPAGADVDAVRAVFDTNVLGVIRVTEAMLPLLTRSPAARIVNLSSSVGSLALMSDPDGPLAQVPAFLGYGPSKTTVNALTVQYAKALRDTKILINAADPGRCDTDLIGQSGFTSDRTAAHGAVIAVRLATLGPDGPTGGLFNDHGQVPW